MDICPRRECTHQTMLCKWDGFPCFVLHSLYGVSGLCVCVPLKIAFAFDQGFAAWRRSRQTQTKYFSGLYFFFFFWWYWGTVEERTGFGVSQMWFQILQPPCKVLQSWANYLIPSCHFPYLENEINTRCPLNIVEK